MSGFTPLCPLKSSRKGDMALAFHAAQSTEQGREEWLNQVMRADEVQALMAVQRAITSRLDPAVVLQMIADEARRLTSADMSAVYLLKEGGLEITVISGSASPDLLGCVVPLEGSVAGKAALSGQAYLVADVANHPDGFPLLLEKTGASAYVIVPLLSSCGPLGTIIVACRQPNRLGPSDRRLLTLLAPGAVVALENARHYENARQIATLEERQRLTRELSDALTQTLFSANLIAEVLPAIWERDPQEGLSRLAELRQLTRGALAEMNRLSAAAQSDVVNHLLEEEER